MVLIKKTIDYRVPRWYHGGLASAGAAVLTHPLDLLKVHLQTSRSKKEFKLMSRINKIADNQGIKAFYNGLTASLFRQLTYSTTRFGVYEVLKESVEERTGRHNNLTFGSKIAIAATAGAAGGFLGTPADLINVRMQNDIKLPIDLRRNYFDVFHGMMIVYRHEGFRTLFQGTTMATSRAVLMTIGQLAVYDHIKQIILSMKFGNVTFEDDTTVHTISSIMAGTCATVLTLPLDVIKTRMMNSTQGTYNGTLDIAKSIFKEQGILGYFRGFVPAFIRLGPQTVLTFIFLEKLRENFGKPIYSKTTELEQL